LIKAPNSFAITFLIGAIALIVPDHAAASRYEWSADGGGNWASAANWTLVDGPAGAGYPNLPGDVAEFDESMANRTITINQSISITQLVINDDSNVLLFSTNGNGRLIFDTTSTASDRSTAADIHGDGQHTISVPVLMTDRLVVTVYDAAGRLACAGGISALGAPALTKDGPGTLFFTAVVSNTLQGTTTVRAGVLELQHFNSTALSGPLTIGTGVSQTPSAIVRIREDDQILDSAGVRILSDGVLELESHFERVGQVTLVDGKVAIGAVPTHDAQLVPSTLTMTGGTIQIARDSALNLQSSVSAMSSAVEPALISGEGTVRLNGTTRLFMVDNGPQAVDLEIQNALVGVGLEGIEKSGGGTMRFTTARANAYNGLTSVVEGRLELARAGGVSVPRDLRITKSGEASAVVAVLANRNFADTSKVDVRPGAEFRVDAIEMIDRLEVQPEGIVQIGAEAPARLTTRAMSLNGGRVAILPPGVLRLGALAATSSAGGIVSAIAGDGTLELASVEGAPVIFEVEDGPQPIDLQISSAITGGSLVELVNVNSGSLRIDGSGDFAGSIRQVAGQLFINGSLPNAPIALHGGTLGGNGRTGPITVNALTTIAPGLSPGILTTGPLGGTARLALAVELNGTTPGTGYDQLKVIGSPQLNDWTLSVTASFQPPSGSRFIIVDNDGVDPVARQFNDLPEGSTLTVGGRELTLTYTGGDGNDVELFSNAPMTYFLAEGATGGFFDDDVLIANPTTTEAAVTMTFLLEGGGTVVEHRTIAPRSRVTVHVDQIAGLEEASPSVQVASDNRVPLVVERTMFWDPTYYGGHTANAVAQPELKWVFAEGFQGFFDTYVLIANANPEPTTATITFLRENDTPVVQTVPVGAFARKTVYAGDYPDVVGRAFGIVVEATRPVIAERAMYFASLPGRLWSGGHANTGIASPSTSWFHAEGATGAFFNTFILLSNPQDAPAHVTLRFLLSTGEVIERNKTIEARQRVTINPAAEGDPRLENAAVSTVVQSDVPIVSERSMYWPGDALPFGEGHNSAGVVTTATHWGLAEGRVGGPRQFQTYVLLANPETTAAEVTVTFLRENGAAPVVKTYSVPATSRFNIDLATVQELQNESFGVRIDVTNGVNIAVERSLYWNANGVFWAGGTNALAAPLP
jgi:autotransporter-associated beta strand protein